MRYMYIENSSVRRYNSILYPIQNLTNPLRSKEKFVLYFNLTLSKPFPHNDPLAIGNDNGIEITHIANFLLRENW